MKNADIPAPDVSAESGKAVERFDCTSGGAQFCQGCYTMTCDSDGEYVRHEDYAKLEQQRAALVEALEDLCAELGQCGMTERARAALKAAGVEL